MGREAPDQVADAKAPHTHLPVVLSLHIAGRDAIRAGRVVEEIDYQGEVEPLEAGDQAQLRVASMHRQVHERVLGHPCQLLERPRQVGERQVLEHVRGHHRIEAAVGEGAEVVHAADHVGPESLVHVDGGHVQSAPAQDLDVQALPGPDHQHPLIARQTLQIPVLVVGVDEIRQVQLPEPLLAVPGHQPRPQLLAGADLTHRQASSPRAGLGGARMPSARRLR